MKSNPFSLEGKTLLITGASSGIGRAIAAECSHSGASRCILVGRREEALRETAAMLDDECDAIIAVSDLSDEEAVKELVESLPELDGAVLNAGINRMKPVQFYSGQDIDSVFGVNCKSPMLLTRHLAKRKRLKKGSSLVFMASISGYSNVSVGNGIYGASKAALTSFMRYAALELSSKGIRCNSVHPGRIETPLIQSAGLDEEAVAKDVEKYPLKRYGQPEEVAYAVIYLLSDAARWVTGSSLVIDGGRSLV